MAKRHTYTSCPVEYDGFSTRTVRVAGTDQRGREVRLVEHEDRDAHWQRMRYHSGAVYMVADESEWQNLVASGLVHEIEHQIGAFPEMQPRNLDELLTALRDGRLALSDDLPTFGDDWDSATGVWSWDDRRALVGTCVDDLEIVPRAQEVE